MEPKEYALMDEAEQRMWWYRALHRRLLDALDGVSGLVLDAGCGTGGLITRMAQDRPDLRAIGVEWSAAAAERAALKAGTPIVRGSVNSLPFADGSFDAVIAADVLCHAGVDPGESLAELRRVLRPGGRLIVNMPAYGWLMSSHDRRVHTVRRQTARQTRAMLSQAGFARVSARYWNGLLLPLVILQRKLIARRSARSDVAPFPPWLDAILHGMTTFERRLPMALPFGSSVLAIAEHP